MTGVTGGKKLSLDNGANVEVIGAPGPGRRNVKVSFSDSLLWTKEPGPIWDSLEELDPAIAPART